MAIRMRRKISRKKYLIFFGRKGSKNYSGSFIYFAHSKQEAYIKAKQLIFAHVERYQDSSQYNLKKIKLLKG
jgi:hypothetical protein